MGDWPEWERWEARWPEWCPEPGAQAAGSRETSLLPLACTRTHPCHLPDNHKSHHCISRGTAIVKIAVPSFGKHKAANVKRRGEEFKRHVDSQFANSPLTTALTTSSWSLERKFSNPKCVFKARFKLAVIVRVCHLIPHKELSLWWRRMRMTSRTNTNQFTFAFSLPLYPHSSATLRWI